MESRSSLFRERELARTINSDNPLTLSSQSQVRESNPCAWAYEALPVTGQTCKKASKVHPLATP